MEFERYFENLGDIFYAAQVYYLTTYFDIDDSPVPPACLIVKDFDFSKGY